MLVRTTTEGSSSTDVLAVANSPMLWVFALGVFAVIFLQTVIYVRAARRAAPQVGLTTREVRGAFRAGAVASVGPSLAVALVAIALLAVFGTPAVLTRIGLIGSASTETASASIAATSAGAELGSDSYTQAVFLIALSAMSLSGGMWMLATLGLTPMLKRGSAKLSAANPAVMLILPVAALIAAFTMLSVTELGKSSTHALTVLVSAGAMALFLLLAHVTKAHWIKEWALGWSILIALVAAYFFHTT